MPRTRKEKERFNRRIESQEVTFVGELPQKGGPGITWAIRLAPLVNTPGEWAEVAVFDSPEQANNAQSNLAGRARNGVRIPMEEGEWEFAARDCSLFAIFRGGKKRRGSRSVPRVERPW